MVSTSKPAQQAAVSETPSMLTNILRILVLRLQGPIQYKTATTVIPEILEYNLVLFPFYTLHQRKTTLCERCCG